MVEATVGQSCCDELMNILHQCPQLRVAISGFALKKHLTIIFLASSKGASQSSAKKFFPLGWMFQILADVGDQVFFAKALHDQRQHGRCGRDEIQDVRECTTSCSSSFFGEVSRSNANRKCPSVLQHIIHRQAGSVWEFLVFEAMRPEPLQIQVQPSHVTVSPKASIIH